MDDGIGVGTLCGELLAESPSSDLGAWGPAHCYDLVPVGPEDGAEFPPDETGTSRERDATHFTIPYAGTRGSASTGKSAAPPRRQTRPSLLTRVGGKTRRVP